MDLMGHPRVIVSNSQNTYMFLLTKPGNPLGLVYLLNFSTPFNTSQNMSNIFTHISKAPNGGAVNNFGQNYYDGTMFANKDEWITYGGLVSRTAAFDAPPANAVEVYEEYWYGPPGKQFIKGFIDENLPGNITRYVTSGAGVSVPSENMGFYFSGLKSQSSGEIFYTSSNTTTNADVLSNTLISVDMSLQRNESWTNDTLPSSVPGRAGAELIWIPVGEHGLLVAIGGVINPQYAEPSQTINATQMAQSVSVRLIFRVQI
jgi:hypothetical protein